MSDKQQTEDGKMKSKPRVIKYIAHGARWFDRSAGNTYHSVRVTRCRDGAQIVCPMEYGYEDAYRQTALAAMAAAKWLPVKYRGRGDAVCFERENNYPIDWNVTDGTKRDCIANGER